MSEFPPSGPPSELDALLAVLGLNLGALDRRTRAAIEALSEEVIALRTEAGQLNDALKDAEALADNDALCPVFNRRAFEREVRREIALAERFGTPLSLIFIDLDNFKQVNDVYGHTAGDDVLLKVSRILKTHTRETDIVGRLGGDEFGAVLPQASALDARRKADQLAGLIDRIVVHDETLDPSMRISVGASCGAVQWQAGEGTVELFGRADNDMFENKARRKAIRLPGAHLSK